MFRNIATSRSPSSRATTSTPAIWKQLPSKLATTATVDSKILDVPTAEEPVILSSAGSELTGTESITFYASLLTPLWLSCSQHETNSDEEQSAKKEFFTILKFLAQKNRLGDLFQYYLALETGDEKTSTKIQRASMFHVESFIETVRGQEKYFLPLLDLLIQKKLFLHAAILCELFPKEVFKTELLFQSLRTIFIKAGKLAYALRLYQLFPAELFKPAEPLKDAFFITLTDLFAKAGDFSNALNTANLALNSNPPQRVLCHLYVGKATIHQKLKQYAEAVSNFEQALKCALDKDKPRLQERLAEATRLAHTTMGSSPIFQNHFLTIRENNEPASAPPFTGSAPTSPAINCAAVGSPPPELTM